MRREIKRSDPDGHEGEIESTFTGDFPSVNPQGHDDSALSTVPQTTLTSWRANPTTSASDSLGSLSLDGNFLDTTTVKSFHDAKTNQWVEKHADFRYTSSQPSSHHNKLPATARQTDVSKFTANCRNLVRSLPGLRKLRNRQSETNNEHGEERRFSTHSPSLRVRGKIIELSPTIESSNEQPAQDDDHFRLEPLNLTEQVDNLLTASEQSVKNSDNSKSAKDTPNPVVDPEPVSASIGSVYSQAAEDAPPPYASIYKPQLPSVPVDTSSSLNVPLSTESTSPLTNDVTPFINSNISRQSSIDSTLNDVENGAGDSYNSNIRGCMKTSTTGNVSASSQPQLTYPASHYTNDGYTDDGVILNVNLPNKFVHNVTFSDESSI